MPSYTDCPFGGCVNHPFGRVGLIRAGDVFRTLGAAGHANSPHTCGAAAVLSSRLPDLVQPEI
jgi:hypothetical protein